MNARPTAVSTIIGAVLFVLAPAMLLWGQVNDENCPRDSHPDEVRSCYQLLGSRDFWLQDAAAMVGGVGDQWPSIAAALLATFGIPAFTTAVTNRKDDPPK